MATTKVIYRRGAQGPEVEQAQRALKAQGFYLGAPDGVFGGATESAVKTFQKEKGLSADGQIGPKTWAALFPDALAVPAPAVASKPLLDRCLELTGSFETGAPPPACYSGLTGDFDGQGISCGALQWNLGQGSLPPLFARLDERSPGVLDEVFHSYADEWRGVMQQPKSDQVTWARSVQTPRRQLMEPWQGLLKALGQREEFQAVQCEAARQLFGEALELCRSFGLETERAVALMFDVKVQNGSIRPAVRRLIEEDFGDLPSTADSLKDEEARLVVIANRRADAAKERWRTSSRHRKLTIARGEGFVHGNRYHLETQYGLRLVLADELALTPQ